MMQKKDISSQDLTRKTETIIGVKLHEGNFINGIISLIGYSSEQEAKKTNWTWQCKLEIQQEQETTSTGKLERQEESVLLEPPDHSQPI